MKKKINILFFGLGSIGQRHLRNLKKILPNKTKIFAHRVTEHTPLLDNKGNKTSGSIEKKFNISNIDNLNFIDKYNIDIVFITNPTSLHIKTILKLKKLKNAYLFIEKPLDASLKNYKNFLNFIKKNKLQAFVGYNMRFHPGYLKIKKIVKERNFFKHINYSIFKCSENIKNNHSYEDYKKSYASRKDLGGGVCLTNIHEIDLMIDLFGDAQLIKSHSDKISDLKINVEDFSMSLYKNFLFKKKLISLIILDFFQINKERYIKIVCDKGELFLDLNNNYLKIMKKNKVKIFNFVKEKNLMYMNELNFFLNLFKQGKKIPDQYNEKNAYKSLKLALKIKTNHK